MSFATVLKRLMAERHISQSELARRLKISSQGVNQWFRAPGTMPEPRRYPAIATALGMQAAEFVAAVLNEDAPAPGVAAGAAFAVALPSIPDRRSLIRGFGERLRTARQAMQLSEAEIAGQIGVSADDYMSWETEAAVPTAVDLAALSVQFQIAADWVLSGNYGALPGRLLQKMVDIGISRNAPEPARELREALRTSGTAAPSKPRTLHEKPAGFHRTITPPFE